MQPASAIIAGILSALIVALFGYYMPSRTIRGTRELEKVMGFQEFLSRVEGDRLNRIVKTPEMFEKFLPYAMALGVEASWAKAFEGIYNKPPDWYGGPGGVHMFRPAALTSDLGRMSAVAATTMASAPRSSGGSGFSGGGVERGRIRGWGGRGILIIADCGLLNADCLARRPLPGWRVALVRIHHAGLSEGLVQRDACDTPPAAAARR